MIIVNGKEINLTEDTTVAEYLEQNQYQVKRIAVELNGDILPKYSYSDTMLKDGDRLEVVTFVGVRAGIGNQRSRIPGAAQRQRLPCFGAE